MSEQLFEVAFFGQISDGANPDEVKAKLGKMFNADAAKLAQLFSGKRIVIKKNVDKATAAKYKTALNRAGAKCEVKSMGGGAPAANTPASAPAAAPATAAAATPAASKPAAGKPVSKEYETNYDGEVEPPPHTDPLGITSDQIEELSASLAPVGSEMQDNYDAADEPQIDTTGMDIAPVGSDLSETKKEPDPPPPDTTGITLAD